MADPPTHFFKFIPPGFKFNLSLPSSFLKNLNLGRRSKVKLRRGRHEWSVGIDDGVFSDGWRRFLRDNGVEEFNFIVFKHQGGMTFDFLVFEQSSCEIQYPMSLPDEMDVEGMKKLKRQKREDYASQDQEKFEVKKDSGCGSTMKKKSSLTLNNHPHFISNLTPSNFKKSVLNLPIQFSSPNGLNIREIILRDDKGRSWEVLVKKREEPFLYLGRGIKHFLVVNGFKEGDAYKFELIEKEKDKPPIAKFSCIHDDREYCTCKLKSTHIRKSYLTSLQGILLPRRFARSKGLIHKEKVYLKNSQDERLWKVELRNSKSCCHLERGWNEFRVANGLKEGDCFKMEVVDKGEVPIVNFYLEKKVLIKAS